MLSDVLLPLGFSFTVCEVYMYKHYLFLSPLKLIYFCWVDSQLQYAEEGIIQSTFVALHGEFSCRCKLLTMLCDSSYIVDLWWYSLNLSQTYHTPTGIDSKKWQHIAVLWQSNVWRQEIHVTLKKENLTKTNNGIKVTIGVWLWSSNILYLS